MPAPHAPTPSQTVGPFFGHALPAPGGPEIAPLAHPDTITLHGYVYDGAGDPVPDALLEIWQPAPDGSRAGAPGSLRRDPVTGRPAGRDGVTFTGFGRVPTDADGHWAIHTLPPGGAPYLSVALFARGLLNHLFTRAYLRDDPDDTLLTDLDAGRRATLLAQAGPPGTYRFDIHLQGEGETVFLEFP
ncbi:MULTISPECIES: protocatechuate 3,4-dioxygenase subunit alpha [Streptomyces]|uniref:Putative protocatechuate 3,4-dioxygenase alpha chain n=1 Tax=Streptomyces alboflavus TaxID=67267 RepID=A0A1Z1WN54_9ACTN|nr:protocatechuate 3,4-dioxygenase subunit alpha [Streptomyces alboflavus]ARX87752.1 putative protocatechuate 3,4-dioxygenase alpha chain [Streptomyces alboflavus]